MTASLATELTLMHVTSGNMVRFSPNVPIEIAVQCIDGTRIEGRYGDRVRYTLTDERTMLVPPIVAEQIKGLAIEPGESFEICKRQMRVGHRNNIHWEVKRLEGAQSGLERDLRASLAKLETSEASSSKNSAEADAAIPPNVFYEVKDAEGKNNGTQNGHLEGPTLGKPPDRQVEARPCETQLAHALKTAIAAAAEAEVFARSLNYGIRFTTEDVRSMGITVLIGMQQRIPR